MDSSSVILLVLLRYIKVGEAVAVLDPLFENQPPQDKKPIPQSLLPGSSACEGETIRSRYKYLWDNDCLKRSSGGEPYCHSVFLSFFLFPSYSYCCQGSCVGDSALTLTCSYASMDKDVPKGQGRFGRFGRFGWMIGRIGADKADIRLDSSIRSALKWLSRQPLLAVAS